MKVCESCNRKVFAAGFSSRTFLHRLLVGVVPRVPGGAGPP